MTNWDFFEKKASEVGFDTINDAELIKELYDAVMSGINHPHGTGVSFRHGSGRCVPLKNLTHEKALLATYLLSKFGFKVFHNDFYDCYEIPLKK